VTNALFLPQNFAAPLALANPLGGTDHDLATWFHERLTPAFVALLRAFTDFGSGEWIGCVCVGVVFCMETMVVIARHANCCGSRRHAFERVGKDCCSQATAVS